MARNIHDRPDFFAGYRQLERSEILTLGRLRRDRGDCVPVGQPFTSASGTLGTNECVVP